MDKKIYISKKRTSIQFLIAFIITTVILFLILLNFFVFTPFGTNQIIVISIYLGVSIIFYFVAINNHYYIIAKPGFIYQKFTSRKKFNFDDIVFIDKEKSESSSNITFITKFANTEMSVPKDRDNELYPTLLNKCRNLKPKEEISNSFQDKRN